MSSTRICACCACLACDGARWPFRWQRVDSAAGQAVAGRRIRAVRADQSGSGVAEQAVAAGALRRGRRVPARGARAAIGRDVGAGRGGAGGGRRPGVGRGGRSGAADGDCRSRWRCRARRRSSCPGTPADSHCGRCRCAGRRHLRSDRSCAERPMVGGRRGRVAVWRVRLSLRSRVPSAAVVPRGCDSCRGDGGDPAAARRRGARMAEPSRRIVGQLAIGCGSGFRARRWRSGWPGRPRGAWPRARSSRAWASCCASGRRAISKRAAR